MTLEIRQLRSFVTVAEEGQVTRAARKMFIAQPALTQALAKLEAHVGVPLFERHNRGVELTPAGRTFLQKARAATAAVEEAERTAEAIMREARITLAWGFVGSPPVVEIPALLAAFAEARADVDIEFRDLGLPRGGAGDWAAGVDVAICHAPTPHPRLDVLELRRDARTVLLPNGHPLAGREELSVSEVLEERFCGSHPDLEPRFAGFWTLDDHRGGPPEHVSEDQCATLQETLACVAGGRGIALVSPSAARAATHAAENITAVPLSDAEPAVLSLVWPRTGAARTVRSLVQTARQLLA